MSRVRIKEKVRGNADFAVASEELTRLGLPWSINIPTGKGHPMLHVTINGSVYRRPVGCTPSTRTPNGVYVASLRRWLRQHGVAV